MSLDPYRHHPGSEPYHPRPEKDVRTKATGTIWSLACGMLGICIPLTAVAHSDAQLPGLVIVGAAVSTVAVWLGGSRNPRPASPSETEKALQAKVTDLEERLASLEVITNFEGKLLEKKQTTPEFRLASVPETQTIP